MALKVLLAHKVQQVPKAQMELRVYKEQLVHKELKE
jgi:hypothetical protein